ncbi:hypothetical protein [Sodalis-like endosymbiont of Proechinophthirus fluctus]
MAGFAIKTSSVGYAQNYCRWLSEQFGVLKIDQVRFSTASIVRLL